MLEDLVDFKAGKWKVTRDQARKVILQAEKSHKVFSKISAILKDKNIQSLKHLYVPRPIVDPNLNLDNDDDPTIRWIDIQDPDIVIKCKESNVLAYECLCLWSP